MNPIDVYQDLCVALRRAQGQRRKNPRSNAIAECALTIARLVEQGRLAQHDIVNLTEHLGSLLARERAQRWAGALSLSENGGQGAAESGSLEVLISELSHAHDGPGTGLDAFSRFQALWSRPRLGVVFTAHPTFAMSKSESNRLVQMIREELGYPVSPVSPVLADQAVESKIRLTDEHDAMLDVVGNFRVATRSINRAIIRTARTRFGERWRELKPHAIGAATWVGYDLDGRADIPWQQALAFRVQEKRITVARLAEELISLSARIEDCDLADRIRRRADTLGKLDQKMMIFESLLDDDASLVRLDDHAQEMSKDMVTVSSHRLAADLFAMARDCNQTGEAEDIQLMASEINAFGYGVAEIHLRVNALQVHNAIRNELHVRFERPQRRSDLQRLNQAIMDVEPTVVRFNSLKNELSTVRRQMMLASIILRYIDADTPIRFLIAECEHPMTLLGALYLARRYDIDGHMDISPLMETPQALERGARMIEKTLVTQAWNTYVCRRKRLCLQTGYSDAGRYIGQPAAALAIERLHIKIANVARRFLATDTEVVVFNTHGESMGRGAYPYDLTKRQNYVFSPMARQAFLENGFKIRHEVSIQGGDGFLLFQDSDLARNILQKLLTVEYAGVPDKTSNSASNGDEDRFYENTDSSLDFFIALKNWHQRLFNSADYGTLLNSYGAQMLVESGSRRVSRAVQDRDETSRLRAIPHNAILQQMGYLAHVCGGIGSAALLDADSFLGMRSHSPRLDIVMGMVASALDKSSLETVEAYADPLDAHFWMKRAFYERGSASKFYVGIAKTLHDDQRAGAIRRVATLWREDILALRLLDERGGLRLASLIPGFSSSTPPRPLDVLHALRVAMVLVTMVLAGQVPPFSQSENYRRRDVLRAVSRMDTRRACDLIRTAFPLAGIDHGASLDNPDGDYRRIEREITQPIEAYGQLFRRLGVVASHAFGAYG